MTGTIQRFLLPAPVPATGRRAFTILELLVLTGVVVVLASILLPTAGRLRSQSRFAACKMNLRSVVQAHAAYETDSGGVKPPLWQDRVPTPRFDFVSPDIKWAGRPVGHGLLVQGGYLTIDALLDPSEAMAADAGRDRAAWADPAVSHGGSSYAYFWRSPPPAPFDPRELAGATYQQSRAANETAVVMDLNAESGHRYTGEYTGRAWVNHPAVRRMNVGYLDGSVRDFPVEDLVLKYPAGNFEEMQWVRRASGR